MNPSSPTPAAPPSPVLSARTLLKSLQEEFPAFRDCLPLAIGIDKQLLARRPDLDRKILRIALGMHTNSLRYIKVMAKTAATTRFDLDGNAADALTDEHRKHAVETLRERSKKEAERRKVQRDAESAQREAEAAERQRTEKLSQLVAKFGRDG